MQAVFMPSCCANYFKLLPFLFQLRLTLNNHVRMLSYFSAKRRIDLWWQLRNIPNSQYYRCPLKRIEQMCHPRRIYNNWFDGDRKRFPTFRI